MSEVGEVITRITGKIDMGAQLSVVAKAGVDAAVNNAKSYTSFIKSLVKEDGTAITVTFDREEQKADGSMVTRKVTVPLLAMVEHPSFTIDELTHEFTVEISDTFEQDIKAAGELAGEGSVGWGPISIKASVKASTSYSNTRKTDTRAKISTIMKASQKGAPEGMMKVLDFLTNNLDGQVSGQDHKDKEADKE